MYNLAMEAIQKAEAAKKSKEEKLLREQYDAMDKQRQRTLQRDQARAAKLESNPKLAKLRDETDSKDRAAGVAVVRTIVKQSQPNVQVDQHTNEEQDAAFWNKKAHEYIEEAAFRYGHPSALVRLGNNVLEEGEQASFTDIERIESWIDESTVDLQTILNLAYIVEGDTSCSNGEYSRYDRYLSPSQVLAACLYKQAGTKKSSEGWYNLGHLLWECIDIDSKTTDSIKDEAFEAFYKALTLGDADAAYWIAVQFLSYDEYDNSEESIEFNQFLRKALAKMNPAVLKPFQSNGTGLEVEPIGIFDDDLHISGYCLLQRAALKHNHGPALYHLAVLHHEVNRDDDEFRAILSTAAATGYTEALFLQGHSYFNGSDGYERDEKVALDNFLEAAENGHADAMVSAGAIFHRGVKDEVGKSIVERDLPRAFDLYQRAGELGSKEGWRNVVSCYASGLGVPKCLETAKYIAETMLSDVDDSEEDAVNQS